MKITNEPQRPTVLASEAVSYLMYRIPEDYDTCGHTHYVTRVNVATHGTPVWRWICLDGFHLASTAKASLCPSGTQVVLEQE